MTTKVSKWGEPQQVDIKNNEVARAMSANHLDKDQVAMYAGHKIQHVINAGPLRIVAGSGTTFTVEILVSPYTEFLHVWIDTRAIGFAELPVVGSYIDIAASLAVNTSRLYFAGNEELETGAYQQAVNNLPQHLRINNGAQEALCTITITPSVAPAPAYNARIACIMVNEISYADTNRTLI